MSTITFPKNGKSGGAPGFKSYKKGCQLTSQDTGFYGMQGTLAKSDDERVDLYAKPGTSAKAREPEATATSFPTSRYRSRRP